MKVPFPRSYWVIPEKLLAGEYPGSRDPAKMGEKLTRLFECGIRHVVNLMEPDERDKGGNLFVPYEESFLKLTEENGGCALVQQFPIQDQNVPSREVMIDILDSIDGAIKENCPVYVHCWGGVGRTGTVIGCYLMKHGMATKDNVFDRIQYLRRNDATADRTSPERDKQRNMVAGWIG
jgi:hypothetical protein